MLSVVVEVWGCSEEGVTNSSLRAGQHPHGKCQMYFAAHGLTESSMCLTSILLCLIHSPPHSPGSASFCYCSLKIFMQDHYLLNVESHVCQYWEHRIIWESTKNNPDWAHPGDSEQPRRSSWWWQWGVHQREFVWVYHGSRSWRDIQNALDSMSWIKEVVGESNAQDTWISTPTPVSKSQSLGICSMETTSNRITRAILPSSPHDGLKNALSPQNICILNPGICECYFIWEKGLCRCG